MAMLRGGAPSFNLEESFPVKNIHVYKQKIRTGSALVRNHSSAQRVHVSTTPCTRLQCNGPTGASLVRVLRSTGANSGNGANSTHAGTIPTSATLHDRPDT